jgi:hypothetical protein
VVSPTGSVATAARRAAVMDEQTLPLFPEAEDAA